MHKSGFGERSAPAPKSNPVRDEVAYEDPAQEEFQPLTKQEAKAFRAKQPTHSPWRVVIVQSVVGLLLAALLGALGGMDWWSSALYGAAIVVVPGAVMVRGLRKSLGLLPGAVLIQFAVWEVTKLLLAVVLMAAAPKLVSELSWPILLLALVVCLKMNWVVLLCDQRRTV